MLFRDNLWYTLLKNGVNTMVFTRKIHLAGHNLMVGLFAAAMCCGAVAGAYYGVPADIREKAEGFLDPFLIDTLNRFEMGLHI